MLKFTLAHIAQGTHALLNHTLALSVQQCYVEFLRGDVRTKKPHVVFKLNLEQPVSYNSTTYTSCRVSMEYLGDPGTLQIRPVPYIESSRNASASFQFPLLSRNTVHQWIDIIQGRGDLCRSRGVTGDLSKFNFVEADPRTHALDGCRDFISQCMVRFCALGLVEWNFDGQAANVRFVEFHRFIPSNGFHEVIGNNFVIERARDGTTVCVISALPLHRGEFLDPRVQRVEQYQGQHLPYHQLNSAR